MLARFKKSGSADKAKELAWHVDFRDVAALPDTKTVRTNFLINTVVFGALAALVLFVWHRESALADLRADIAALDAEIAAAQGLSDKVIAEYKLFQAEEAKFREAASGAAHTFRFGEFVTHLAKCFPVGVKANRIDFRGLESSIVVSGDVQGQDVQASETASRLITALQEDMVFKQHFDSVKLTNVGRNAAAGSLDFEVVFNFKKFAPAKGRR